MLLATPIVHVIRHLVKHLKGKARVVDPAMPGRINPAWVDLAMACVGEEHADTVAHWAAGDDDDVEGRELRAELLALVPDYQPRFNHAIDEYCNVHSTRRPANTPATIVVLSGGALRISGQVDDAY